MLLYKRVLSCILLTFVVLSGKDAQGYPKTNGSFELNYQRIKVKDLDSYSFGQKMYLSIVDNLWVKNQLLVSLQLLRNQYSDQSKPEFRPRFSVNLSGYKYRAFYRITPYKVHGNSGDITHHRTVESNISFNPTSWPRLQLSYYHTHSFDNLRLRKLDRLSRYYTLNSNWQYKSLNLSGTYTRRETLNKVTGVREFVLSSLRGASRLFFNLPLTTSTSWDYNFSFTQKKSGEISPVKTPSHSFSTIWAGRPLRFLSWSVNYLGKLVQTEHNSLFSKTETHSLQGGLVVRITGKWIIDLNRSSISSKRDGKKSINDYFSIMTNLKDFKIMENVSATTSFRRTYYIHSDAGSYGINWFYFSSYMRMYREIDARFDLTVNYNDNPLAYGSRYQVVKNMSLVTRPKENLRLDLNYRTTVRAEKIAFVNSEIENYRFDITYLGKGNLSLHTGYQANIYNQTKAPNSYSFISDLSFPYRKLFSTTVSYVRRWSKDHQTGKSSSSDNLSSQFNFSLGRQTKLTLTHYVTDIGKETSSTSLGVILNQQF